jgi:ubiquinone/menaquinone biosynthesis C-methylase UbiE
MSLLREEFIDMSEIKTSDTRAVRDMYDGKAESYSEMMDSEINHPLYSATFGRLQASIANIPGILIDAPCGSGHMLSMYHDNYDKKRALLGIDLSPAMVEIAAKRLGSAAEIVVGDIRHLEFVPSDSASAVISHFAFHHLDPSGVTEALKEWQRVLKVGGQLVIAAWEGTGSIDYFMESDLVTVKHDAGELTAMIQENGFSILKSFVETDDEMLMDAVYVEATKD